MASIKEETPALHEEWEHWLRDRPAVIQALGARFKPWRLYRLNPTGYRVVPFSFNENGTLTVAVLGRFNLVKFEHRVFGVPPEDLEECDLPAEGELVGVTMNAEEAAAWINQRRALLGVGPLEKEQLDALARNAECALSGKVGDPDDLPMVGGAHGHTELP